MRLHLWQVRGKHVDGVRVLALDGEGRVLLVRHSYGQDWWMPPGGGLKAGEDPLTAAARELVEETGRTLTEARLLEIAHEDLHGVRNVVRVVAGRAVGQPVPDGREVVAARFFALNALPQPMSDTMPGRLRGWLGP